MINYEVQSPINQVLKNRIREKKDRIFFLKKKHYLDGTKLECSSKKLAGIYRTSRDYE